MKKFFAFSVFRLVMLGLIIELSMSSMMNNVAHAGRFRDWLKNRKNKVHETPELRAQKRAFENGHIFIFKHAKEFLVALKTDNADQLEEIFKSAPEWDINKTSIPGGSDGLVLFDAFDIDGTTGSPLLAWAIFLRAYNSVARLLALGASPVGEFTINYSPRNYPYPPVKMSYTDYAKEAPEILKMLQLKIAELGGSDSTPYHQHAQEPETMNDDTGLYKDFPVLLSIKDGLYHRANGPANSTDSNWFYMKKSLLKNGNARLYFTNFNYRRTVNATHFVDCEPNASECTASGKSLTYTVKSHGDLVIWQSSYPYPSKSCFRWSRPFLPEEKILPSNWAEIMNVPNDIL